MRSIRPESDDWPIASSYASVRIGVAVPLAEPTVSHKVGLVAVDRETMSPLIKALFLAAQSVNH